MLSPTRITTWMFWAGIALGLAASAKASGPDVSICRIGGTNNTSGFANHGVTAGIRAFSVASLVCNFGDAPLTWDDDQPEPDNNHPVISQTMFRLGDGRLVQIGQSWLKHAGNAVQASDCGSTCQPGGNSSLLGIGCCDAYRASINGTQFTGPKSEVNPVTGFFPYPFCAPDEGGLDCPPPDPTIGRRMQVKDADLDTAVDVQYFVQVHFVAPDEALVSVPPTDDNNASYRPIAINAARNLSAWTGLTVDGLPAIWAWRQHGLGAGVPDLDVQIAVVDVPGDGRFLFAGKAVDLGGGLWRYEYAVQNYNSDRAGGWFSVPLPAGAIASAPGFDDVDSHSGEPYALTDWVATLSSSEARWDTETYAVNTNANALRWDTMYNFHFESTAPPTTGPVTFGLFKPGAEGEPPSITALLPVPSPDCNDNGVADAADIAAGTSVDINGNGIPDECQAPCPADFIPVGTGDGFVDVNDLLAMIGAWGPCLNGACPADIAPAGGDGLIDINDLLALIGAWGQCPLLP